MKNELIEKDLRSWFDAMIDKYNWLKIHFEFNNDRGVWLVSFAPNDKIDSSVEFNEDAMKFANLMNDKYGIDAPLFTDDEDLFVLSSNAETIDKFRGFLVATSICMPSVVFVESARHSIPGSNSVVVTHNSHHTASELRYTVAA